MDRFSSRGMPRVSRYVSQLSFGRLVFEVLIGSPHHDHEALTPSREWLTSTSVVGVVVLNSNFHITKPPSCGFVAFPRQTHARADGCISRDLHCQLSSPLSPSDNSVLHSSNPPQSRMLCLAWLKHDWIYCAVSGLCQRKTLPIDSCIRHIFVDGAVN
jgi:hypothetical protein